MINITSHKSSFTIPSSWEELSSEQYIAIIAAIVEFEARNIDFETLKISIAHTLTGGFKLDPKNKTLCENVYRLTEVLTFPYKYIYNDKRYDALSEEAKLSIKKKLPGMVSREDPELRIAESFEVSVALDICLGKQLLPKIGKVKGYRFERVGATIETSLTASQYVEANTLLSHFFQEDIDKNAILDSLAITLYSSLVKTDAIINMAIMYNYMGICEWIAALDKYDLIFNRADGKRSSSPLGSVESLCDLAEKGYGDFEDICQLNLFTYLDMLLKQTLDSIRQMDGYKIKREEIASKLNLTLEQINTVLQ